MAGFETVQGVRVVARAQAIEELLAGLADAVTALRIAPDDVFLIGYPGVPACSDPDAIVETDRGFSGSWFTVEEFENVIRAHMEWPMPPHGTLGQGLIAGVPAKVHINNAAVLVVCPTAFVHELEGRLV